MATQPRSIELARDWVRGTERLKRVTSSEKRVHQLGQSHTLRETNTQASPQAHDERLQSSDGGSRRSATVLNEEDEHGIRNEVPEPTPTRRGLWDWARAGTGKFSTMGRVPHPDWKDPVPFNVGNSHTQDDFSVPSTTGTKPDKIVAAARLEGVDITDLSFATPSPYSFSQTKHSSDDLVATASSTGSPEFQTRHNVQRSNDQGSSPCIPDTPTPQQHQQQQNQRRQDTPANSIHTLTKQPSSHAISDSEATLYDISPVNTRPERKDSVSTVSSSSASSPNVTKYKIALAPHLLPPSRGAHVS